MTDTTNSALPALPDAAMTYERSPAGCEPERLPVFTADQLRAYAAEAVRAALAAQRDFALVGMVLLESPGEPWAVSFAGSNPPPEQCVACASKEDALRLMDLLAKPAPADHDLEGTRPEDTALLMQAVEALEGTRRKYGEPGSRDVDIADWNARTDRAIAALTAIRARLAAAPAERAVRPVLVRDIAELLGITVPDVCKALMAAGRPPHSTNMAVSGEEVAALRTHLASAPAGMVPQNTGKDTL